MKKIILIFAVLLLPFLGYYGADLLATVSVEDPEITVAACPTFHYMLNELDKEGIRTIRTNSTNESIDLLKAGDVDFSVSGRALSSSEPSFLSEIIGPGLSFVFIEEIVISRENMLYIPFYTDLPKEKIRKFFPDLEDNLMVVEDVYQYLEEGIGITSVENTDYDRSSVVHVISKDGKRERFSRTPVLYFSEESSFIEEIKEIIKEEI